MQLIQSWLDGPRNFSHGRILYKQFGTDESLKKLFADGETKASKESLVQALMQLTVVKQIPKERFVAEKNTAPVEPEDEIEAALQRDWKEHLTHLNQMRGQLDAYGTDNSPTAISACHKLCVAILEEERYINACWEKLDYYRVHKQLPELEREVFEIPENPVSLGKLIESTLRNIRRNRQKAISKPNNAKYPALIAKYEALLKKIHEQKAN